jgi:hypothetical protein
MKKLVVTVSSKSNQIHNVALELFTRESKKVLFNRYEDWMKIELQQVHWSFWRWSRTTSAVNGR